MSGLASPLNRVSNEPPALPGTFSLTGRLQGDTAAPGRFTRRTPPPPPPPHLPFPLPARLEPSPALICRRLDVYLDRYTTGEEQVEVTAGTTLQAGSRFSGVDSSLFPADPDINAPRCRHASHPHLVMWSGGGMSAEESAIFDSELRLQTRCRHSHVVPPVTEENSNQRHVQFPTFRTKLERFCSANIVSCPSYWVANLVVCPSGSAACCQSWRPSDDV